MSERSQSFTLWAVAAALVFLLGATSLFLGEVNQDEGWYLYAARRVSEGARPYADFAFTQGPVMACAYGLAYPLVERWGVAGGRLITATFGLAACLCAAALAFRLARAGAGEAPPGFSSGVRPSTAALLAFALVGVNTYQSYFFTVVKTYALAGLLLTAGFLALTYARGRRGWLAAMAGGVLLAMAAATRSSLIAAVPVVFACLALDGWRAERRRLAVAVVFGAAAGAAGIALFLPFLLAAPRGVWFGLVEYHAGRSPGAGLIPLLAYKGGFLSRVIQHYFVALALWAASAAWVLSRPAAASAAGAGGSFARLLRVLAGRHPDGGARGPGLVEGGAAAWLSVLAITALHIAAPFPYDDYQAPVFPVLAAALGSFAAAAATTRAGGVGDGVRTAAAGLRVPGLTLLLCAASAFSSPLNQTWFVQGRDRVWWPLRQESSLRRLQRAAAMIRETAEPGGALLTQDAYLAVEAGLRLPPGLELGPFSYFPDWSRERAESCRVVNREMLAALIASGEASVAALSGWSLSIRCPSVTELTREEQSALREAVDRRYEPWHAVTGFGQADTTLVLYRRR